ncbi:hypothetical protein MHK_010426, partial [Candidatus Magnetomorum sp. HK-1]
FQTLIEMCITISALRGNAVSTLRRRVIIACTFSHTVDHATPERRICIPTQSVGTRVISNSYRDVYNDKRFAWECILDALRRMTTCTYLISASATRDAKRPVCIPTQSVGTRGFILACRLCRKGIGRYYLVKIK